MYFCSLTKFPDVLCKLKSLKELKISWTDDIQTLRGSLDHLKNLETLSVLNQGQTEFPKIFCQLDSLKKLCISYNFERNGRIDNSSDTPESLAHLEIPDMSNCDPVPAFAELICKLKSLKNLTIMWDSNNPNLIGVAGTLDNLTNLEILTLKKL